MDRTMGICLSDERLNNVHACSKCVAYGHHGQDNKK